MQTMRVGTIPFSVSGTGVQAVETGIMAGGSTGVKRNMRVRRFVVREAVGGLATAASFYFLHKNRASITLATEPRENIPIEITAVPLVASATALSLDTPITAEPCLQDSINIYVDVTAATGAWTILGWVEFEL